MLILFPVIMACDVDLESLSLEWYTQACESCHDRGWTPVGCLDFESRSVRDMAVEIPRDRQGRAHVHIVLLSLGPRISMNQWMINEIHTISTHTVTDMQTVGLIGLLHVILRSTQSWLCLWSQHTQKYIILIAINCSTSKWVCVTIPLIE